MPNNSQLILQVTKSYTSNIHRYRESFKLVNSDKCFNLQNTDKTKSNKIQSIHSVFKRIFLKYYNKNKERKFAKRV